MSSRIAIRLKTIWHDIQANDLLSVDAASRLSRSEERAIDTNARKYALILRKNPGHCLKY